MKVSLFLIFAVVAATSAHKCMPVSQFCAGAHQEYTDCYGEPSCQYNCEYPSGPYRCHKMCVAGCRCKNGYVEDENRNCIKVEECPVIAPQPICQASEHKTYSQCNAHCPIKTCENPEGPQICTRICSEGCICEEGYLQDKDGKCIKPEECPATIPDATVCPAVEHKVYTQCDAMCRKTCENPSLMICPAVCADGCICEEGYLEDSNGNCILPEECPATIPDAIICPATEHKMYSQCSAHCPIKTCENPEGPQICTFNCVEGCICEEGYLQDSNGNCIMPEECPATIPDAIVCPASEHKTYTQCNAQCPIKTCENPNGPMICPLICAEGCVCEDGYLQDSNGNCVLQEECPATVPDGIVCAASEHKKYSQCSAHCPIKTCENPEGPQICPASCVEGCVCEDGYLQDGFNNCITPDECPAKAVPAICLLPQVTGPCKAAFPKWGYNSETGTCTQFTYGGCGANSNNFNSQEECNISCL